MKKIRLDKCLWDLGLFDSREQAKKAIMAGLVAIDGQVHTKAGDQVPEDITMDQVVIKGNLFPYVSRGGLKLEKGIAIFPFPIQGRVFLDIGSSTGGFTDCLLQNGAQRVYAIDVGYGQLDWKLRNDDRVVCMERTNFRYLTPEDIGEIADATVMDVSFISILKLIPAIAGLTKEGSLGIWLIKPQFEVGKEKIGKNGVVREVKLHEEVLQTTLSGIMNAGYTIRGLDFSPIRGPKGNIEFLCFTQKGMAEDGILNWDEVIKTVVADAHAAGRETDHGSHE
ncbi:TlyA family RNA methyltransferase [Eubacterium barkeri]|uniref:23S rRNA (Cytidine1920-2'-O)/16S rRNA (Cytidine1409-2'-O)-methyltransferase n=1 Tax=Eubacterium barkeri TaxID=1528 RepID=A0A1H3BF12_EUBBA|nr:TlyA family RNA methyltransferase [Eubacterium barkeri]SDX40507.1 23S rRNA (cytidine1920-2'-O)/16S rRNA (cytidine1409-2'-O)-methyltransferase [Eubacterium barkeri]